MCVILASQMTKEPFNTFEFGGVLGLGLARYGFVQYETEEAGKQASHRASEWHVDRRENCCLQRLGWSLGWSFPN